MNSPSPRQHRSYFPCFIAAPARVVLAAGIIAGCGDIDGPAGPKVSVCHSEGSLAAIREIFLSELAGHRGHGDYITQLQVDKISTPGDDIHFSRITDALASARAGRLVRNELDKAACRITIVVAAGTIPGSTAVSPNPAFELFPLIIDVPDITLKGALKMQVDGGGRATGVGEGGDATTFAPNPAVSTGGASSTASVAERIIIVNGHPDGPKGHGAIIEGFVFQSGRAPADTSAGGQGIGTFRVRDLVVFGNRFEGGFNSSMDLQASSARVERNHLSGPGSSCDICLAGPGDYIARDNRVLGGGIPGILVFPAVKLPVPPQVEPYTLPATALVTALVVNNEVRGHLKKPVGVGLRAGAVGVGASSVAGTNKVTFAGNNLVNNTFGIIIDASFLSATDPTQRRGDIEVTTSGNTISQSCQNDLLVSLSGSQTGLGISSGPALVGSTYNITLGADISWDKAWFAHAAGTGNTLIVNGQTMASGSRRAYDASRVCTP